MTVVLVLMGGALGAPARYFTDRAIQARHDSVFPWGTFTVNVVASFVLGLVVGGAASAWLVALVGAGFCGALSTYSSFSYETMRLLQERSYLLVCGNLMLSVVVGLGAAAAGLGIGTALSG